MKTPRTILGAAGLLAVLALATLFLVVVDAPRAEPDATSEAGLYIRPPSRRSEAQAPAAIYFRGTPQGGSLTVFVDGTTIEVQTIPGESLAQLAARVATAINASPDFTSPWTKARPEDSAVVFPTATDAFVCSNDSGLGIPKEPQDLDCTVRTNEYSVAFRWRNPQVYDRIRIVEVGVDPFVVFMLPGATTRYLHYYRNAASLSFHHPSKHTYGVIGIKGRNGCIATCEVEF